jgi:hypothetical protein
MAEDSKYTHVGVLKSTHKKIAILKTVANGGQGVDMYQMIDAWANQAWEEAREAGLVTDAMLPADVKAHWVGMDVASGKDKTVKAIVSPETVTVLEKPPHRRKLIIGKDR